MNTKDEERMNKMAEDYDAFMPQLSDLADFRFRSELIRLMGSDKILLSDPYWSNKLIKALREDYERQLDEVEDNLREVEGERMKQLRMAGFITDTDKSTATSKDGGPPSAAISRKTSTSRKSSTGP